MNKLSSRLTIILWIRFLKEINNTVILLVLWNWAITTNEVITTMFNAMIYASSGESTAKCTMYYVGNYRAIWRMEE